MLPYILFVSGYSTLLIMEKEKKKSRNVGTLDNRLKFLQEGRWTSLKDFKNEPAGSGQGCNFKLFVSVKTNLSQCEINKLK